MTRQEAVEAVVAERYGPPVRQRHGADGPVAEWLRQQAVDEAARAVDESGLEALSEVEKEGSDVG